MTTLSGTTTRETDLTQDATGIVANYDRGVILIVGVLMTVGVVMVHAASVRLTNEPFSWKHWWTTPMRQVVFSIAGFAVMVLTARLDYRRLSWGRSGAIPMCAYALAGVLLILMMAPGVGVRLLGASRAIYLLRGPFSLGFQPAELAKVILIVWLAALLSRPLVDIRSFRAAYLPTFGSALLLIALTGVEDYGTAALMGVITMIMLLVGGARWRHLTATALLGMLVGVGLLLLREHRWQRLVTFFSDQPDPAGRGYQITQSLIAIGSGGWWGRGLGGGVQNYGYLPQANNDFVFSILCEQLGGIGGLCVIALFLALLWRGRLIARRAEDPCGRLLAVGITLMICLQAAFNIAVVTNSVPTKGISLPFVSAGGSGLLFLGAAAGLLASVGAVRTRNSRNR